MKFSEFQRCTPARAHIYAFVCGDDFLVEESHPVWARIFGGDWRFEKLTAKEFEGIEISELMRSALTPPLFGPSRALVVAASDKIGKNRLTEIEEVAGLDTSFLKMILVFSAVRSVAKRPAFPVVEIDALRPGDTMRWLRERYGMSAEAARYLIDAVGTDLGQLHSEIEKLRTYVRDARPVEIGDIDQLILRSEQFAAFDLDDALLERNYSKTVRIVGAMLEEGVEPILILSRLIRVWRQIFIGKYLAGRFPPKDIAGRAAVPHWKAASFVSACGRFDQRRVVEGFRELLEADKALKTSSPKPEYYFDVMLWKLIR